MNEQVKVNVVEFSDRKFYMMQWRDPATGRKKTRSTKVERTGRKRERTEAERVAALLEAELKDGRYRSPSKMTWDDFRLRHETEVQPSLAPATREKFDTVFNAVESMMHPRRLRDVTTQAISRWVAELHKGRADATAGIYCRHLMGALNWAVEMGFLSEAPKVRLPKGARQGKMKGRPITREEHERITMALPKVKRLASRHVDAVARFLEGLWWSGLRLSEAHGLSWEPTADVSVMMQPGYHPALKFQPEGHKAGRAELVPCAPEFAEMLEAIPEGERSGRVFPVGLSVSHLGQAISDAGKAARVLVDEETGKPATAHDYRRAFGTRWAKRLMPAVLKRLMRHKDIQTTLKYYVGQDVEDIAGVVWEAYRASNTSGNTTTKKGVFPGNS